MPIFEQLKFDSFSELQKVDLLFVGPPMPRLKNSLKDLSASKVKVRNTEKLPPLSETFNPNSDPKVSKI